MTVPADANVPGISVSPVNGGCRPLVVPRPPTCYAGPAVGTNRRQAVARKRSANAGLSAVIMTAFTP